MSEKENSRLFREKSLQGLESPESLCDYLRVTTPGVWLTLAAIVIFLTGALLWGVFGHIRSTETAAVISENGQTVCLVPEGALDGTLQTLKISVGGEDYTLVPGTLTPELVTEDTDVYVLLAGELSSGDVVYRIPVDAALPDGVASGLVVTEELRPIAFLINE